MVNVTEPQLNFTKNMECLFHEDDFQTRLSKVLAYSFVIFFSLIGNGIVIYIFCKNRSMRSTTNRLIVNMAASDIMLPILVLPRHLVVVFEKGQYAQLVWHVRGDAGEFFCKVIPFLGDVSHAVSILSLVLIASDRYLAIIWPLSCHLHFTPIRCNLFIAATWGVAAALHAPYFHTFHMFNDKYCISYWRPLNQELVRDESMRYNLRIQKAYFVSVFVIVYVLPLAVITILYTSIIRELGGKKRRRKERNHGEVGRRRRKREDKRVIVMLVLILTLFALFFAPIHVLHFLKYFVWNHDNAPCGLRNVDFAVFFLTLSTCCLNPYIYFIFIRNYRRGFKNVLKSLMCLKKTQSIISHEHRSSRSSSRNISEGTLTSLRSRKRAHNDEQLPCCDLRRLNKTRRSSSSAFQIETEL